MSSVDVVSHVIGELCARRRAKAVQGAMNYAAECIRRGRKWFRKNKFTLRMEYRYLTVTERETFRAEKGASQGVESSLVWQ